MAKYPRHKPLQMPARSVGMSAQQAQDMMAQAYAQAFNTYMVCWMYRALYSQLTDEQRNNDAKVVVEGYRHQMRVLAKTEFELKVIDALVPQFLEMLTAPIKTEKAAPAPAPAPAPTSAPTDEKPGTADAPAPDGVKV